MPAESVTTISSSNETVTVSIRGAFSFPMYKQFRELAQQLDTDKQFVIDLAETTYMDSSALGILLQLRDEVDQETAKIRIVNCRPEIRKILAIAHFDKIFDIH
jgi:anti-anti-sigma factor